jgi:hypothetical protein
MDCHGPPRNSDHLVIARNEAIHRPSYNDMDCHGAARLAMTELGVGPCAPAQSLRGTKQSIGRCAKTWIATALRASQ